MCFVIKVFYAFLFCCTMCFFTTEAHALQNYSRQGIVMSQQCPTGGEQAEELYQLGRQYRYGHGVPIDKAQAEKLFKQALAMGNAKAAIQIGQMYMWDFSLLYSEAKREKYMIAMYEQAAKMGCPEAYLSLAECYEKGWGVKADKQQALALLAKAAEMGSPKAMEYYGVILVKNGQVENGRKLLERSMALGNGDAGVGIATIYQFYQKDAGGLIEALRAGARLGSKACIQHLTLIYLDGDFGQAEDEAYASRLDELYESMNDFYPPKPIPDFDTQFPPKPILPFKD